MNTIILEGAFWGHGKCPECNRKYQKDLRVIWYWDKVKKKVHWLRKMCSWCLIVFIADCLKKKLRLDICWQNDKK